ncbi:MAG TPA: ECF transporter S component [Spirochaetota bacterium]|nr:ECF transporter S component [Spirochaetota bacterium]
MSTSENTLSLSSVPNILTETALIAIAIALPVVMHLIPGINVFATLPMHWTIFIAGLLYGWKGGLIAGVSVPTLSFALTGMPVPFVLPLMTVELSLYGFVTGLLSEKTMLNRHLIVLISSIAGRAGFVILALLLSRTDSATQFAINSFAPGIIAAFIIIACTPVISKIAAKNLR